jgi:hypothetical protein
VWLVVAGVGVLIGVIVVVVGGQHPSQPAPGQPAPSGHQSAAPQPGNQDSPVAGHTKSYQNGYWWAYDNSGRKDIAPVLGVHPYCASAATQQAPVLGLNAQEWTQGCEDALIKMGNPPGPIFSLPKLPQFCEDETKC